MTARSIGSTVGKSVAKTVTGGTSAGSASLPLDSLSALAAFGLGKLRTAYTGSAIRVRRSSDNTEQDIGFSGASLNSASLLSFCGAGNGFITKWYDQSGNAYDAAQTTTTLQPRIVASGVYDDKLVFDASDDYLALAPALITGNFSISIWLNVATWASVTNVGLAADWSASSGYMVYVLSGKIRTYRDGEFFETASALTAYNGQLLHLGVVAQGTSVKVFANGALFDSGTLATKTAQTPSGNFYIASYAMGAGSPFGNSIRNLCVFNTALTDQQITNLYGAGS